MPEVQLVDDDGEVKDSYSLPEHKYYIVQAPNGALITELSDES